jgi:hypothetical protein
LPANRTNALPPRGRTAGKPSVGLEPTTPSLPWNRARASRNPV